MKTFETILVLIFLVLITLATGYGAYAGYMFLSVQWDSLSNDWRAILNVAAAMLFACTLLLYFAVQSPMKKYGLRGSGKAMAYNNFLNWYSQLKNNPEWVVTPDSLRPATNQMILWGSERVARQVCLLFDLLQEGDPDRDQLLEKAGQLYTEIRRDLGQGRAMGDVSIV